MLSHVSGHVVLAELTLNTSDALDLAQDASTLYWVDKGGSNSSDLHVRRINKNGAGLTTMQNIPVEYNPATGFNVYPIFSGFDIDNTDVFYRVNALSGTGIFKMPKIGDTNTPATQIGDWRLWEFGSMSFNPTGSSLFVTDWTNNEVFAVNKFDGGRQWTLTGRTGADAPVIADSTNVYWVELGGNRVMQSSHVGGTVSQVIYEPYGIVNMAADVDGNLFWLRSDGAVVRNVPGGNPEIIAVGAEGSALAVDDYLGNVYYVKGSTIKYKAKTASVLQADQQLLRFDVAHPFYTNADQIVVDKSSTGSVYWVSDGELNKISVHRHPKPVTPTLNHAPVLDPSGSPKLTATKEDVTSASVTVATILGTSVTDLNVNALEGMAVTGLGGGGTWQYSTDGGATFKNFGTVSESAARLLAASHRIRFVPTKNFHGDSSITFRAWDRTTGAVGGIANITAGGTGGRTAFSVNQETASITVTPVNDAPVLVSGSQFLPAILVNDAASSGITVDSLAGGFTSDVDAGAAKGIAVFALSGTASGKWQFSTTGGASWANFGSVASTSARLLDASHRIRFLPNLGYTLITSASILPTITYRAWDHATGIAGSTASIPVTGGTSAFSTATRVAKIRVNTAPVLTPAARMLGPTTSNKTFVTTVATLLGTSVQDFGTGTRQGIAITGLTMTAGGKWQYSINGGVTFLNLTGASNGAARLLRATDKIRYVPLAGSPGAATLTYRAWDQTTGVAGNIVDLMLAGAIGPQSAFSSIEDTATLTVS